MGQIGCIAEHGGASEGAYRRDKDEAAGRDLVYSFRREVLGGVCVGTAEHGECEETWCKADLKAEFVPRSTHSPGTSC